MPTITQRRQPKCKNACKYNYLKQMQVWAVISIIIINSIIKTHLQGGNNALRSWARLLGYTRKGGRHCGRNRKGGECFMVMRNVTSW